MDNSITGPSISGGLATSYSDSEKNQAIKALERFLLKPHAPTAVENDPKTLPNEQMLR